MREQKRHSAVYNNELNQGVVVVSMNRADEAEEGGEVNKATFEKIVSKRAESIYQAKKSEFSIMISTWLKNNPNMNAHSHGHSLLIMMDHATNDLFEKRKSEIIASIEESEVNSIMQNLNSVKFLFDKE